MKKKYARTKLVLIAILVLVGLCLSVVTFNIPNTSIKYLGFVGAMDSSAELDDSYKVILDIDREDGKVSNSDINEAVEVIYDIFTKYIAGYSDVRIVRATSNGQEQIIVYVPNQSLSTSFFDLLGEGKEISGKTENGATVITNKNIDTVQYTVDANKNYGVYIKFDNKGTEALIKYADALTFTLDGLDATTNITNNMLFIYNSNISSSQNSASTMPISLLVGKINFAMTVDSVTVDALSGSNTATLIMIVTIVFAVLYVVYSILRHKMLGLVSLLSTGIFFVADTFILQSISIASLQLASYLAIMLSFIIYMIANEYQIEKMENYNRTSEKVRLPYAIKNGYKDSLKTLVDLHLVTLIINLCTLIMGGRMIRAISINFIVGIVISALLTMLINRYFIKLLCDIYPNDYKKFNFTKGETTDEI